MNMEITFPNKCRMYGREGDNSFTLDVNIARWVTDARAFQSLYISGSGLYLQTINTTYGNLNTPQLLLGWKQDPFPFCCGYSLVYDFVFHNFPEDVLEKWWKWIEPMWASVAIGVIPFEQNTDDTIGDPVGYPAAYRWLAKKGTMLGNPVKNIQYSNHVLYTYLWFKSSLLDKVVHPTFGMVNFRS